MEVKTIDGFEKYTIDTLGNVVSYHCRKPKTLKSNLNHAGYPALSLNNCRKIRRARVHRLVAEAFIPNPESKRTVNHKNGIKTDNRVENLEWATHSENHLHSYRELGRDTSYLSRSVVQMTLGGQKIRWFPSLTDTERKGFNRKKISRCCDGLDEEHRGFRWEYA